MAKKDKKKEAAKKQEVLIKVEFSLTNYILFAVGIFTIIIGFISLSKGSITLAPLLLIIGYLVFIPLAILLKPSKGNKKKPTESDNIKPSA